MFGKSYKTITTKYSLIKQKRGKIEFIFVFRLLTYKGQKTTPYFGFKTKEKKMTKQCKDCIRLVMVFDSKNKEDSYCECFQTKQKIEANQDAESCEWFKEKSK